MLHKAGVNFFYTTAVVSSSSSRRQAGYHHYILSKKGLAEWFSSKFTLYVQSFDYSTSYFNLFYNHLQTPAPLKGGIVKSAD